MHVWGLQDVSEPGTSQQSIPPAGHRGYILHARFTKIDLSIAYQQMELDPDSK